MYPRIYSKHIEEKSWKYPFFKLEFSILNKSPEMLLTIRNFSLLNVNVAGACGYDFRCDGGRLVRAYLRR